jgi:hypothetical protein
MDTFAKSIILGDDLINRLRAHCVTFDSSNVSLDAYNQGIDFVLTGMLNSCNAAFHEQARRLAKLKLVHGFQMPDDFISHLMGR